MTAIKFLLFTVVIALCSCSKEKNDTVMNGVNVDVAVSTMNAHRAQGYPGNPPAGALVWDEKLSLAAYNFARAKLEDPSPIADNYSLSTGQSIFTFPAAAGYVGTVTMSLYAAFPSTADVKTVIDAAFVGAFTIDLLMDPTVQEFGMGRYENKWYLIMGK